MKAGWGVKKLGEVCDISTGKSNTQDATSDGEYAFFDRSKKIKRSSKYLFDCEAIIVAGEGQTFFPKFYSGKFDLHQRAYALFNFNTDVNIRYVYNYLTYFHKYFQRVAVGATAKSLRLRHFLELPLPIPPLAEQEKIVTKLDEVFEKLAIAKENTENNFKNAGEIFQNYFDLLIESLKKENACEKLASIAEFKNGLNYTKNSSGERIRLVGVSDFQDHFYIDSSGLAEIRVNDKLSVDYELREGDLLVVRSNGSPQLVGRLLLVRNVDEKTSYSGFTIRIRRKIEYINPTYLCYYLKSNSIRKKLTTNSNGTNIKSINQKMLANLEISLPPIETQNEVIKKLELTSQKSQKLKQSYQQKVHDLDELKQSILQKAFNGELT